MSNAVGPSGHVIAIEAIELACHLKNRAIGNIDVIEKAIAAQSGSGTFHVIADDSGYSGLRERGDLPKSFTKGVSVIDVPVTTLDVILADRTKPVRLIKMDLEGGEYHAILGGRAAIGKDRPFIIFESGRESSARLYGYSRDDFFNLFGSLDLRLFDLFGRPFGPTEWEVDCIPWNFIAVEPRSADERFVTDRLPRLIQDLATPGTHLRERATAFWSRCGVIERLRRH
jgi:FkbM family methyltransferase